MTENHLGEILKEMYEGAPNGYKVAKIHLFGIKHADVIERNRYKAVDIVKASGLNPYARHYGVEVSATMVSKVTDRILPM